MKILCLPYAGSSATTYIKLNQLFPYQYKIVPIEIPGRGLKSNEKLLHSISGIVDNVYGNILDEIQDQEEYVIFGHSMGGIIAFELCHKLMVDEGVLNKPKKLIVSGCMALQNRSTEEETYKLPLDEFKDAILVYGLTTSIEVFENKQLLDFFIPVMRADFEAVEKYKYADHKKLNIDISVFWGIDDQSMKYQDVSVWRHLTSGICTINSFPGSHFYLFDDTQAFVNALIKEIEGVSYCLNV